MSFLTCPNLRTKPSGLPFSLRSFACLGKNPWSHIPWQNLIQFSAFLVKRWPCTLTEVRHLSTLIFPKMCNFAKRILSFLCSLFHIIFCAQSQHYTTSCKITRYLKTCLYFRTPMLAASTVSHTQCLHQGLTSTSYAHHVP